MKNTYLITGATGSIGYAFTQAVLNSHHDAIILVRDYKQAYELFDYHANLTIVQGDVLDTKLLRLLAQKSDFVMHAVNVLYDQWATFLPAATESIINACSNLGNTIIFPGNNYGFGSTAIPISEMTPNNPTSELGRVRVQIESMLQEAAKADRVKVLNVRLPEIWGPNVTNPMFAPVFTAALKNKAMPWIINTDIPQQLMFSLDAGRLIMQLSQIADTKNYNVYHVAGTEVSSIKNWLYQIAKVAGSKQTITVPPTALLKFVALFNKTLKHVFSLSYKYTETIRFDDSKLNQTLPEFSLTPMDKAIAHTLSWFEPRVKTANTNKISSIKKGLGDFTLDNAAIGLFPLLLAAIGSQIPFVSAQAALFGVVAGIYWTMPFKQAVKAVLKSTGLMGNSRKFAG